MSIIKIKKSFILLVIILFNIQLYAVKVEHDKAKQVAVNFVEHIFELKKIQRPVIVENIIENSLENILCYYTVCFKDGGYINIAATDASIPVLSYSLTGYIIPFEDSPPAYINWMESYKSEIHSIIINNADNSYTINKWKKILNKDFSNKIKTVGPLTTSEWGQSRTNDYSCPGYNNHMPVKNECTCQKCAAGCVAIAMAQIMYYWKHPINVGFYTYYDWCNMNDVLEQFGNENFENELAAVSKLVYDCAEAVDMDYCSNGCSSGASTKDAVEAFELIFGYHQDADYKRKSWYSNNNWKNFIKNDLNNGQPIMYRGEGSGGHAFICDGYQVTEGDEFHFNWGWYGDYSNPDDWFTIDNLNPGGNNYSNKQAAIFHIKPHPNYYFDYCKIGVNLFNIYYPYYTYGGTLEPWEIVPETMQVLFSCPDWAPEQWRTIPEGVTAKYIAHKRIVLQPGFHAKAGSHFIVKLEPCLNCDYSEISDYKSQDFLINYEESIYNSYKIEESINLEKNEKSFSIYPNPHPGIFTVEVYDEEITKYAVQVVNMMGKTVYQKQKIPAGKTRINITSQPKGIYFVKVQAGEKVFTEKVVYK